MFAVESQVYLNIAAHQWSGGGLIIQNLDIDYVLGENNISKVEFLCTIIAVF